MNKETLFPHFINGMNSVVLSIGKIFLKDHWGLVILAFIIAAGFYLRVSGVLTDSFAFTYDVGRDLLEVQKIVQNFDIPLIGQTSGLGGLYYGPWWYYILTPSFIISGGNPQGIAFFIVLIGIATILLGYVFGKKTQGTLLGIIVASFFSLSSAMVALSNQIWNPNLAPFLLILLFPIMFFPFKSKRLEIIRNIFIGFLLGLILDSEIVFGVLLTGGVFTSYAYFEKLKIFSKIKLFIFLGFFLTLLPRVAFEIRHNFIMTKSFFIPKKDDQQVFNAFNFFNVLPDRIAILLDQIGETFGLDFITSIIFCMVVLITWIILKKKQTKIESRIFVSLVIILAVFVVGSSIFARAVWGHYLVGLPVIYIMIASLTLLLLIRKNLYFGIIITLVLVILSARPFGIVSNFQHPNWEGNAAVYRNQVSVIDYIYKDASGREFNYIAYTPAVHDYTYQYLFNWYGSKKYAYRPTNDSENLLYIIIEPDPGYEGRIIDWLKIREGDGKIVGENTVKGGIKVQKRSR